MKLTLKIKLLPTEIQRDVLLRTMERFNEACNFVSEIAFRLKTGSQVKLHHEAYYTVREQFGLSSQMTVRAVGKVAESYEVDKNHLHSFRPHGAMVYDQRILTWKTLDRVSVLTLDGRILVPYVLGDYYQSRLKRVRGQADLILVDGIFYLCAVVDVPEPPMDDVTDYIGVDLGIVNIAADSEGEVHSGGQVNGLRKRYAKLRARLQAKQTKSAKRLLKKRKRKEARFAKDVNHCISKKLVAKAKDTGKGIALEDLKGIRSRITVWKAQRRVQHSWGFFQLRAFVEYKAKLAGVPVVLVDPRNTSRTCPACGHISKNNRKTQALFLCVSCGFSGPADPIAAENIRRLAVNQAYAVAA